MFIEDFYYHKMPLDLQELTATSAYKQLSYTKSKFFKKYSN